MRADSMHDHVEVVALTLVFFLRCDLICSDESVGVSPLSSRLSEGRVIIGLQNTTRGRGTPCDVNPRTEHTHVCTRRAYAT